MAVNTSWPISETANSATRTGCRLSHGGVSCGDCRRAGNGRYALSANHGAQYASTHGYMGSAAIDRLCTPQGGAASTYTPIGRALGQYSQNRCVICEAASKTPLRATSGIRDPFYKNPENTLDYQPKLPRSRSELRLKKEPAGHRLVALRSDPNRSAPESDLGEQLVQVAWRHKFYGLAKLKKMDLSGVDARHCGARADR